MSFARPLYTKNSSGGEGATGAQGAEGVAGGAGLVLYYNYNATSVPPYALQRTIDISSNIQTFTNTTVLWRLNPTVTAPFTISGGTYQSVIYASGSGTIQITNIVDELTAQVALDSNIVTVTGSTVTPYTLLGIINTGPFNFNTTTNTYINLQFNIIGTVTITYQDGSAYSHINLATPILIQGQTGSQGAQGATGFQGATG